MWALRRAFWNLLAVVKFRSNRPARIPIPRDDGRRINAVSLASQFPGIPIPNIRVADHVPADEASRLKYWFYQLQVALYRLFSPMQRLVNANFNLNVRRAQLMQDFSYLALDARGAQAFRQFKDDLQALQTRIQAEPPAYWKMTPAILEANINA